MSKDEQKRSKARKASYEVLTGLNYGNRRVQVGETVSDIPVDSVSWLLEQGHIKRVEESEAS